jgi:long-chain acyl-CoA synthetase
MSTLLDCVQMHANQQPDRPAISDGARAVSYRELDTAIVAVAQQLRELAPRRLGLLADNGIAWVTADLAALAADIPLIPLPLFFSPQQLLHAIAQSGMDAVLTDRAEVLGNMLGAAGIATQGSVDLPGLAGLCLLRFDAPAATITTLPDGTAKITYTSGTTGTPKGVCLSSAQIDAVAQSLQQATLAVSDDRHLCLTPLSTLLENIGGIYVALRAGACTHVWPLANVGLSGASGLDPAQMLRAMHAVNASSAIMVPQILQGMLQAVAAGMPVPPNLRFIAVGGAPVSQRLLQQAAEMSIPVFEGYGLSECASVVALNTASDARSGSVGRPLPHLTLSFASDQEILVSGAGFLGYLGESAPAQPWPTGDIGYLDEAGFLHLQGRKKSIFITSFGRNVAPEWVERELTAHPAIRQAAVFGEARPFSTAVITPAPEASAAEVQSAIDAANHLLPDYARVACWVPALQPFSTANQLMTSNGRLRRASIWSAYAELIKPFYQEKHHVVL